MMKETDFLKKVNSKLPDSNLRLESEDQLKALKSRHPSIPEDYIDFLKIVGAGTFDKMGFRIYGGPLDPDEIFDEETAKELSKYVFIGDDYSGWQLGYDISKSPYELVFFNHDELVPLEPEFQASIISFLHHELFER